MYDPRNSNPYRSLSDYDLVATIDYLQSMLSETNDVAHRLMWGYARYDRPRFDDVLSALEFCALAEQCPADQLPERVSRRYRTLKRLLEFAREDFVAPA